jgi:ubiquinone/menaquinone biosynthesis C-methylase UbiE
MRVSPVEAHRLWAPIYELGPNPLLALERRSTWALLRSLHPARVIDVGCGTGHWVLRFQQLGTSVFGLDACQEMLAEATKRPTLSGRLIAGDVHALPFREGSADLVLCSLSLGYFGNIQRAFSEFARVVAKGGHIAVSDLHPDALAAGWTRSFKLDDLLYEIDHHTYSLAEIDHVAQHAGLQVRLRQTAYFDEPERRVFQDARKADLFDRVKTTPALFTCLWEKPC